MFITNTYFAFKVGTSADFGVARWGGSRGSLERSRNSTWRRPGSTCSYFLHHDGKFSFDFFKLFIKFINLNKISQKLTASKHWWMNNYNIFWWIVCPTCWLKQKKYSRVNMSKMWAMRVKSVMKVLETRLLSQRASTGHGMITFDYRVWFARDVRDAITKTTHQLFTSLSLQLL